MLVRELANLTDVPAHVIRYYTEIGLLKPERDPRNRYRVYASSDISRVLFIRRASWMGFTLRDLNEILCDANEEESPSPEVRQLIEERARDNRIRLEQHNRLQLLVEEVILQLNSTTCNSLCDLIESIATAEVNVGELKGKD